MLFTRNRLNTTRPIWLIFFFQCNRNCSNKGFTERNISKVARKRSSRLTQRFWDLQLCRVIFYIFNCSQVKSNGYIQLKMVVGLYGVNNRLKMTTGPFSIKGFSILWDMTGVYNLFFRPRQLKLNTYSYIYYYLNRKHI